MRTVPCCVLVLMLAACGPDPRTQLGGSPDAAGSADAPPPRIDAAIPPDAAPCGQLFATLRDFTSAHPDMQSGVGIDVGLVEPMLGPDGKPVYRPSGPTSTVAGAASFDQWYRDVPGVNLASTVVLPLVEGPPGTFTYDSLAFFPLDGQGLGNEGNPHNYHFTTEIRTTFAYHGGETFEFSGDDDVFVFVNNRLAIDLGGVHDPLTGTIDLDARALELGISIGSTYAFDVFHAERHTVASTFKMTTTIECLVVR